MDQDQLNLDAISPHMGRAKPIGIVEGFLRVAVKVKASHIDSRGVFATTSLRARQKIGELGGELIGLNEARRRASERRRIAIVELHNGRALDGHKYGSPLKYLNHSCSPNTFIRIVGTSVEVYALRKIRSGEELTCDYGETQHEGKLPCRCGSSKCRGRI